MTFVHRFTAPRRAAFVLLVVGLGFTVAGCAAKGDVSGVVKYKGKPLTKGTVTFTPVTGAAVTSDIGADGSYKVSGIPTGSARIAVSAIDDQALVQYFKDMSTASKSKQKNEGGDVKAPKGDPKQFNQIPDKYGDPNASGLSFDVKGGPNTHNIDLD